MLVMYSIAYAAIYSPRGSRVRLNGSHGLGLNLTKIPYKAFMAVFIWWAMDAAILLTPMVLIGKKSLKSRKIFGFQDMIEVVTVGFAEPAKTGQQSTVPHLPGFKFEDIHQDFQCIHLKESLGDSGEKYGDGEKNKKVKLQTLRRHGSKSFSTWKRKNDLIQELVNTMRPCKEKVTNQQVVDKMLRTLPLEFDYVAAAIEESKDLDTMEVEELQHSLEAHEMRMNKRRSTKNRHCRQDPITMEKEKDPGKRTS
ncbi:hypothetical protein CR513_18369, partial [Mucuna pruriens]